MAQAARTAGHDGDIVLIGDEPSLPYRRPSLSKEVLRGEKTADDIRIKKPEWYDDQRITLMTPATVTDLDLAARRVLVAEDTPQPYDVLVLATGGVPRSLPGQAREHDRIRVLRQLADVPDPSELTDAGRLLIVGGGLIGAELAASARDLGVEVTMLEAADLPLPQLLPAVIAERYAALHRERGVDLHTGVTVANVDQSDGEAHVRSADGREWSAPLVFVSIGIEPAARVAERAGLRVDDGVVVDAFGRASDPAVYAVGDVANWPHPLGGRFRSEHWQGAQNQGTAIGRSIGGTPQEFAEVPWAWSDQYDVNLQITGWPDLADDVRIDGDLDELDFFASFTRRGELIGAVGIGRPRAIRTARKTIGAAR